MGSDESDDVSSFWTQSGALFRKTITIQKRNMKQNISLIFFPAILSLLIFFFQNVFNNAMSGPRYQCGCQCVLQDQNGTCLQNMCGLEYSGTPRQASACAVPSPRKWPALLQVPVRDYRAVSTDSHPFHGLPDISCRMNFTCPATTLFTGQDQLIAGSLANQIHANSYPENPELLPSTLPQSALESDFIPRAYLGTNSMAGFQNLVENAIISWAPIQLVVQQCPADFRLSVQVSPSRSKDIECVQGNYLWRADSSSINNELYKGYRKGNPANEIHEILGAYDFLDTNKTNFNVIVWYNSTYRGIASNSRMLRIPKSVNMVSNAFIQSFGGADKRIPLSFVKEMPKKASSLTIQLNTIVGPLFYTWVVQLLLPVFLASLVYEKQHKLRTMMKLHGLRDAPYWVVTYSHFLLLSCLYMIWSMASGYVIGLNIFRLNSYTVQIVFYFLCLNLQIAFAFLAGNLFSDVKITTVVAYMYVFASGLLGDFLLQYYIEDASFRGWRLMAMELVPAFSLYRGLYELRQYSLAASYTGIKGMTWENLGDEENGMKEVLIIMAIEWLFLLIGAYILEQANISRNITERFQNYLLQKINRTVAEAPIMPEVPSSTIIIDQEFSDLREERYKVEQLLVDPHPMDPIICHDLEKVYGRIFGKSRKNALQKFSLSVPRGECFGLLGPSGAGKTTFMKMMTGFLLPTSGTAFINNKNIRSAMDKVQTKIGVCPQHDILFGISSNTWRRHCRQLFDEIPHVIWETLTAKEHLLFYGRLRNLKGAALERAVEEYLRSFNLYNVRNQCSGGYSGGMKRRLSVAMSLIGDTKVVFLDEPTGALDIESRSHLWRVVKKEKMERAIVLTTHSMEEAEFLCDRLGIIVSGRLQCVGNSKELKTRYGRSYLFTISVDQHHKDDVDLMVSKLSPNALKIYDVGGTQKYQLPKTEVRICDVFEAVDKFRREVPIHCFGLNESSLEDVFNNVVGDALEI